MISYGFVSMILAVLLEGAILYVLDRHAGVGIYRWWHDITHKNRLPVSEDRGFIYQRKANAKFTFAIVVTLIQNALLIWRAGTNPLAAAISIPVEVVALLIGFYLGPFLNRLWERRRPVLDVVDRIESGETTVAGEARKVVESIRHHNEPELIEIAPLKTGEVQKEPAPKTEPEPDPRELIRKFTQRG